MNSRARVQATTKNLFSPGIEYLASKLASFPCQVSWQIYLLARLGWTRFLWRVILASVNNLNKLPWHVFLGTVLDCIAVTLFFDKWFVTEELVESFPYREDNKNSSTKTSFVSEQHLITQATTSLPKVSRTNWTKKNCNFGNRMLNGFRFGVVSSIRNRISQE